MSDALLEQFLIEGREQIEVAETSLARLRRRPDDSAARDACFRAVHTLKGSTGFFDVAPMGRLLHGAEDLLSILRRREATTAELDFVTEAVDQIDRWLSDLAQTGDLPADADQRATTLLARGARSDEAPLTSAAPPGRGAISIRYVPRPDAYFAGDDPIALISQVPGLTALSVSPREPFGDLAAYDPFACNLVIAAQSSASRDEVARVLQLVSDQVTLTEIPAPATAPRAPSEVDPAHRTIRVDLDRIDRLAALVDDIVIGRGGLAALALDAESLPGGRALAQALRDRQANDDRLAAALHGSVARLRLVPLSPLFARFPRIVRDIARDLGKVVDLESEAGDAELDRSLADGLFEPLLHVLRNAVDHGIESAEQRRAAGKPERATIGLSARADGDRVIVEARDDGAGLDPDRLRDSAVRRGLLSVDAAAALSEAAALDLIFLPGFSTRDSVSEISGRGVGMDAVRRAVGRLGGLVKLNSVPGQGLCVRFELPLTIKLTRLIVVGCGVERYAFDLADVLQVVRVTSEEVTPIRAGRGFAWRDQPVPLVSLAHLAGVDGPADLRPGAVMVVQTPAGPLGLAVDTVIERIEAAVRPPAGLLAAAAVVSGATLASDGGVLMVLDPAELVRWA